MSKLMVSQCVRCEQDVTLGQFFSAPVERIQPALARNVLYRLTSGALLLVYREQSIVAYCPSCAPSVWYCMLCGCTDEIGCEEGCSWARGTFDGQGHVCSRCSPLPVNGGERNRA